METTSLFSSDDKMSKYSSTHRDEREMRPRGSRVSQAAMLIRDAYVGFQDAPVEGYYDVCSLLLLLMRCALLDYCLLT